MAKKVRETARRGCKEGETLAVCFPFDVETCGLGCDFCESFVGVLFYHSRFGLVRVHCTLRGRRGSWGKLFCGDDGKVLRLFVQENEGDQTNCEQNCCPPPDPAPTLRGCYIACCGGPEVCSYRDRDQVDAVERCSLMGEEKIG